MRRAPASAPTSGERGQALVMVSLTLFLIFALLALVVDLGFLYFRHSVAQTAADSAAMAAALAAEKSSGGTTISCTTSVACQAATACPSTIPNPPTSDVHNACLYAQQNGFTQGGNGGKQNVWVAANVTAAPGESTLSTSYWVTVTVSESFPSLFGAIFQANAPAVSASATAAVLKAAAGTCIYSLDPNTSKAIYVTGSSSLTLSQCGMYIDSNNSKALYVDNAGSIAASSVNVVGNYYGQPYASNITPTPTTGAPVVADPYANISAPSFSNTCDHINYGVCNGKQDAILPGVYCGGISVGSCPGSQSGTWGSSGQLLTMSAGVYVLLGGGLTIGNGYTVTGTGVGFYNTGNSTYAYAPVTINGGAVVQLSAPTTGALAGMLIYEDRTASVVPSTSTNSISNGSTNWLTGAIYMPRTILTFGGMNPMGPMPVSLIARQLLFSNDAKVSLTSTGNAVAAPGSVGLIQ
jgi:hypothetical protein